MLKKTFFRWSAAYAAVVIALLMLVSPVSAQDTISLVVSPPLFELSANPGDRLKNSVRLENPTDDPREVNVEFRNFTAYGEEGAVDLTEEDTSYSLADWLSIDRMQTTIPARGNYTFTFFVDVPANAEPGGHFGSIVFKTKADSQASRDESGALIEQELGALLLVKVAGDIREDISIASFEPTKSIWEAGPVTLETRVENKGNVHTKAQGTITINNVFGRQVASIPLDQKNVLPGAIRKLSNEWSPSGFTLGRYTATVNIVSASDDSIVSESVSFWVIPYKLVAILLVVVALLIAIFFRYRKRINAAMRVLRGKA